MAVDTSKRFARLLVCGGRDFSDWPLLDDTLWRFALTYGWPDVLIHGKARGADRMAGQWAELVGVPVMEFEADWNRHGRRAAGPIRNARMLAEGQPDYVIAFAGGPGTANMTTIARAAGVPVQHVSGRVYA